MTRRAEEHRREPTGSADQIGTKPPYVKPHFPSWSRHGERTPIVQTSEKLQTFIQVFSWLPILGFSYLGHEVGGIGGTAAGVCAGLICKMASIYLFE